MASPVQERVQAVLASSPVITGMQQDLELIFPHATARERFTDTHGCLTDVYYAAADWGAAPTVLAGC